MLSVSGLIVFRVFRFVFLVCQKIPPLLSELKVCLIAPTLQRLHSLNRGSDIHNKRDEIFLTEEQEDGTDADLSRFWMRVEVVEVEPGIPEEVNGAELSPIKPSSA